MALSDIIERIREDARAEAERLVADGSSRAGCVLEAARRDAERRREELLAREAAALAEASRNRLAGARLAARGRVLALRRALLEEVLAAGVEAARSDGAAYAGWLGACIAGVPAPEGVEIEVGRGDLERFGPSFAGAVAREADLLRPARPVVVREAPAPFAAGVAVYAAASVYDFSLDSVIRERRERWETEVARVLFGP